MKRIRVAWAALLGRPVAYRIGARNLALPRSKALVMECRVGNQPIGFRFQPMDEDDDA